LEEEEEAYQPGKVAEAVTLVLFGWCTVRISAGTPTILTGFHDFPQSLQANAGIIP
jgi:hypothetical protein